MKNRICSALLAVCMLASLLSVSAYATETQPTTPTDITQPADTDTDPVPGAPTPLTAESVQELIDALPTLDAYLEMEVAAQQELSGNVTAITDALATLTDEQKSGLHTEKYDALKELLGVGAQASDIPGEQPEGDGQDEPYKIRTPQEMIWFQFTLSDTNSGAANNAILMNDISMQGVTRARDASHFNWEPMCHSGTPYTGTFDGNGKTISGLEVSDASADAVGLFKAIGGDGVVKNLTIADSTFTGQSKVGAICGTNEGTIEGCVVDSTAAVSGVDHVGGICGHNFGSISLSTNSGNINVNNSTSTGSIGGICGRNGGDIDNCASNSAVTVGTDTVNVGGVCGSNEGTINNCYYNNEAFTGAAVGSTANENQINYTKGLPAADFASGKAAWLLNTVNISQNNTQTWAQGSNIPKLANADGSDVIYNVLAVRSGVTMIEDGTIAENFLKPGDAVAPLITGSLWMTIQGVEALRVGSPSSIVERPSVITDYDVVDVLTGAIEIDPVPATKAEGYGAGQTLSVKLIPDTEDGILPANLFDYQWMKDGAIIPGATDMTYTIPVGLAAGNHDYSCEVAFWMEPLATLSLDARATDGMIKMLGGITAPVTFTVTPAATAPVAPVAGPAEFTVNAWVNVLAGGTVSPMGITTHKEGENASYTITPAKGYRVTKVLVDGVDVGAVTGYTFSEINRNHEIGVYFEKTTATVAAIAPATGDSTSVIPWIVLIVLAVAGLGGVLVLRRKKHK